ncbi:hypothetical protein [Demequina zhanjiangensis]|uniref:Uncharacterized protein n=1 Tax=Demequina zhanjiangensis TaxID=3051659 RepID=A0ABT8FYN6_9MICO|nr:hypothetical protein [Demequina sp. SYSU T00b26]MDN4472011.1 hypothetical protein [Demequina sp. SYSU T00b26]
MDQMDTAMPETLDVSRRHVMQGMAWAAPAILVASAVPAAASSLVTCNTANNGSVAALDSLGWAVAQGGLRQDAGGGVETGWTPAASGTLSQWNLGGGTGLAGASGFQSMSDNTLDNGNTVVTVTYTFDAVANTIYTIDFSTRMQHGFHEASRSARQSLVLTAEQSAGATQLIGITVDHGGSQLPATNRTDAQMRDLGYQMQPAAPQRTEGQASDADFADWSPTYTAMETGQVTLQFVFTLEPVYPIGSTIGDWDVTAWDRQVSDDIWLSEPRVFQSGCLST